MVLAYLQTLGVIPNLQAIEPMNRETIAVPKVFIKWNREHKRGEAPPSRTVDVTFCRPTPEIVQGYQPGSKTWSGTEHSVPSLFYGFMQHFGYEHAYKPSTHVSVKAGGILVGREPLNPFKAGQKKVLVVVDPFGTAHSMVKLNSLVELERNCTSSVDKALDYIIPEFQRAVKLIEEGASVEELFAGLEREKQVSRRGVVRNSKPGKTVTLAKALRPRA